MKKEKLFNFCYCIGASIVIIGAWQKIEHREYADVFLTIGLVTEAVMFLFQGIQELYREDQVLKINENGQITDDMTETIKETHDILKSHFK